MKLTDIKVGDKLVADGGFTCLEKDQICEVFKGSDGDFMVHCKNGTHCLKSQVDHNPESPTFRHIIGFTGVS